MISVSTVYFIDIFFLQVYLLQILSAEVSKDFRLWILCNEFIPS